MLSVQALVMRSVSSPWRRMPLILVAGCWKAWLPVELAHNDISADLVVWELEVFPGRCGSVYSATHPGVGGVQSWLAQGGPADWWCTARVGRPSATNGRRAAAVGLVRSARPNIRVVMLVDSDGSMDVGDVIGCGEEQ